MSGLKQICPKCFAPLKGRACACGFITAPNSDYAMALPNYVLLNRRYILLHVIGAGGFGVTYKAMDTVRRQVCAIKEYVPIGVALRKEDGMMVPETASKAGIYRHAKQRFMEEAYILQKLNSMPTTVTITDCFEENGTAYFVMEYIRGRTIKAEVVKYGKLTLPVAMKVITVVASALERIHKEAGIFHRDISPENIMLSSDGTVKLLDFGSAKFLAKQTNQNFTVVLKSGYAPPEQYSSVTPQGAYTDVYALASTFYYMLTGVKIPAAPARIDGRKYTPLSQIMEVPEPISQAIDHALMLSRRERTQTCGQFLLELGSGIEPVEEQRKKNSPPARNAYICIFYPASKQVIPLCSGTIYRVGRSTSSDIVLPKDPRISNLHFYLYFDGAKKLFAVKDVSRNGMKRGKERLPKDKFQFFHPDTVLSLAEDACKLRLALYK